MKNIYEEPKLEVIKFNIKETIMTIDGTDPAGAGDASEMGQGGEVPPPFNDPF